MQPTDKYIYENEVPSKENNFSKNSRLHNSNDLFRFRNKKSLIEHVKIINKYTLTVVVFFFFLIIFNL